MIGSTEAPHNGGDSRLLRLGELPPALDRLPLPLFAVDRAGTIVWLNKSATELLGPVTGRKLVQIVSPESRPAVETGLSRQVLGTTGAAVEQVAIVRPDGRRVNVEISSSPVAQDGQVMGVFGAAVVDPDQLPTCPPDVDLSPREAQVLQLLATGASTEQMTEMLGLSRQTVRNHIRSLLRRLGVHSRLEAVVEAHRRGLIRT